MPVNKYFNNVPQRTTNEQDLYEDLINEAVQIRGHDIQYFLRESRDEIDWILGEDPTSKFTNFYTMEVFVKNVKDFDGNQDFLSKFGLEIQDDIKFLITGRTFARTIPAEYGTRPREGDLIYSQMFNKMFEITFVKNDPVFYSLGRRSIDQAYWYEVSCETFKFSHEKIVSGIPEIDSIVQNNAFSLELYLSGGPGDFLIGEEIYQGASYETSTARGVVASWDNERKIIRLTNIQSEFANGSNITGYQSNTSYIVGAFDDMDNKAPQNIVDNILFEQDANIRVINTESNPFGSST